MPKFAAGIVLMCGLFLHASVMGAGMSQAWVEEQMRQISGYAGSCNTHESVDVCNGRIVRLYANLAADLTREVFNLCAKKENGAKECEETVRKLIEAYDDGGLTAITLQAQINGENMTHNGMSRALLSRYIALRGEVETLKAILPK